MFSSDQSIRSLVMGKIIAARLSNLLKNKSLKETVGFQVISKIFYFTFAECEKT
jgi:hypothetical protein